MSGPLRITMVLAGYNMAGGTRVLATYAERLRRRGHDIVVVAPPPRVPALRHRLKSWVSGTGWPRVSRDGPSHFERTGLEPRLLDRNRPVADDDVPDADVVIATWWETAEWVAALDPSKGAKVHFIQGREGSPLWFPPSLIPRVRAVYALPLARVTISRSLKEWLEAEHGLRDVPVVPNSVDLELFHALQRGRQPHPTVGLLYHEAPLKGVALSLRALERVRREIADLQLVAFGQHPTVPSLPLPAWAAYHVNPPQNQLRALYARCDVWLCGSRIEGFALPPLEAMACRCPVVSTRVGGPDEIVVDGVSGYLVPVDDENALVDRLRDVLTLPADAWQTMSAAALSTAQGYTWDDATDRLEAALRDVCAGRAASRDGN